VRVVTPAGAWQPQEPAQAEEAGAPGREVPAAVAQPSSPEEERRREEPPAPAAGERHERLPAVPSAEPRTRTEPARREVEPGCADWRDRALRLQAEMDNYRKRQQRQAQDQVVGERERLLRGFLGVVDDLDRALAAPEGKERELREGIELTRRSALRMLAGEGVTELPSQGRAFDPQWHEAVATVPSGVAAADPGTVVRVMEPGYGLSDRLLRPAKVIVAA
jgi:molecular chaperone GrpE